MGYALINLQFADKRAGQREVYILTVLRDGCDRCKFLNNTRKHTYQLFIVMRYHHKKGRTDDLVKTPVSHDMGVLRRCNPPAFEAPLDRVITWPAIDKRINPSF